MDKNILIRDYIPGDYKKLSKLWFITGLSTPQRGDDDEVIKKTLAQGGKLLVMEIKETLDLIGSSWITNDGRRLYLHHFAIHPAHQGKKYAIPLVDLSLQYAKSLNMQIKLEVHKDNVPAINLYTKNGFSYLGDYLVFIIRSF
ncbi:MAG: GNAT family N-acetyltransferase [Bacteroidales bacterium]|nr:GNAT family N-acetyltransferase [Bacteroidales bacterium]